MGKKHIMYYIDNTKMQQSVLHLYMHVKEQTLVCWSSNKVFQCSVAMKASSIGKQYTMFHILQVTGSTCRIFLSYQLYWHGNATWRLENVGGQHCHTSPQVGQNLGSNKHDPSFLSCVWV